ncbi:translocation/assembly module TamB domain-containing protein [Castellaniella sp.]|uniref:translocation/assembly module TamB domain-containing protein n=1 Tax=Castellaniella sp. TaxID=1955812 RepID=UPI0035613467
MRVLRRLTLWVLPPMVLAVAVVAGFVWWSVFSTVGTRWTLHTAVALLDGEAEGITGSIWRGVSVRDLSLTLPDLALSARDLHLAVAWRELLQRRLHVRDLSAQSLVVRLPPEEDDGVQGDEAQEPFAVPELPVAIQVDRLALGRLQLIEADVAWPVDLRTLDTRLSLEGPAAEMDLQTLELSHQGMSLSVSGQAKASRLAAPWPFSVQLQLDARESSPAPGQADVGEGEAAAASLCLRDWLPSTPETLQDAPCQWQVELEAQGSLDAVQGRVHAVGEGMQLNAEIAARPQQAFPLETAQVSLRLPAQAGLDLNLHTEPATDGLQTVRAQWQVYALPLNRWLPREVGASRLDMQGGLRVGLTAAQAVQDLGVQIRFDSGSQWNGQALQGHLNLERLARHGAALYDGQAPSDENWTQYRLAGLDAELALGPDRLQLRGTVSADQLDVDLLADFPRLAALWPGLQDGARLALETRGSLAQHQVRVQASHDPDDAQPATPGQAPSHVQADLHGEWTPEGWRGAFTQLRADHAGLSVRNQGAFSVAVDAEGAWQVGEARLGVFLNDESLIDIHNQASSGHGDGWHTRGRVASLVVTPARIRQIQEWLAPKAPGEGAGGVQTVDAALARDSRLDLSLAWDLGFEQALSGSVQLRRLDGDLVVPGDVPVALGLQETRLDVDVRVVRPGLSQVQADLRVDTEKMGRLRLQAETPLHASAQGGLSIDPRDEKRLHLVADSEDLAWVNLLLDGALEVGGTVHADVRARSLPDERWVFDGPFRGEDLRVLLPDQGVRLLDGVLQGHFEGERVVLEQLRFPAVRRVVPKEWRTATWIAEEPDAQNGDLKISGQWQLADEAGTVQIDFHRYPILQRSDRYAMISGSLGIRIHLPEVILRGTLTADAGWFDLDMLSNVPSLDGDVVILKAGETSPPPPASPPLDIEADLHVDLGPRFYITGYGVNAGLVGQLDLSLHHDQLTAMGALRTRGGSIDAYGQHLQLRRGIITFQGDLTNPVLNIEALRTNQMVQAGVRVIGTARQPRIDLVSYPDVSEAEKLSWLLLGRGPDEAGGADMSLLLAVGSSFLADGEPFYRRFGLDELGLQRGQLGSTGSLLPPQTVVSSGLDAGASALEQQFVLAGKNVASDVKLSLEQALSDTGTVARLGYRLMRGLQAEVTVGTVNGLALVYTWFSRD